MDKATIVWLVFAVACGIVEVVTPSFGFILISAAAVVTAIASAAGYGAAVQIAVFAASSAVFLTVLRSYILRRMDKSPGVPSRTDRLVGRTGRVTEAIDPATGVGRVVVDGHDWAAQAADAVPVGAEVRVDGADGIKLRVRRV